MELLEQYCYSFHVAIRKMRLGISTFKYPFPFRFLSVFGSSSCSLHGQKCILNHFLEFGICMQHFALFWIEPRGCLETMHHVSKSDTLLSLLNHLNQSMVTVAF